MPYFAAQYDNLKFPIAEGSRVGLRPAQVAATQAVAAHFFGSTLPAIVTMPTGAGKTTVLMACAFILRARRVLVVTPSRLVREQIAENFKVLADLKKTEALPISVPAPKVFSAQAAIKTVEQWDNLTGYDVVVATVPGIGGRDAAQPPDHLFDLVLVDEAHHSPSSTWARLLATFGTARQVLFTATPFRRDDKEIKGKFVFTYDLRRAYDDRVFGDILFQPVARHAGTSIDISIARATEVRLREDQAKGFRHLVMVRVDSLARGKELVKLYAETTTLKLAFVSGSHSLAKVTGVINQLKRFELDGVVCVNMFGEGFNLPALKIAAVHSPHKSLAITLQFIGRFARTNQADIGPATFLAEPMSSNAEISELYEAGAVWRDIIENLSSARIESEIDRREILDSFAVDAAPDMEDFSLYTVRPYFHVKVFNARLPADFSIDLEFPARYQVIYKGLSETSSAIIYLTRQAARSPWSSDERFTNVSYDVFIFHYNPNPGLLFISASRRDDVLYARLATQLLQARPRILAHSVVSRALNELEAAAFFSVGMRKRHTLGRVENYRTSSGTSTDRAIDEVDSRMFGRGHCFGTATEDGKPVTIGVSASSKVWSNTYDQIPELLHWCDAIATKIASGVSKPTGSRLDLLSVGEELTAVPAGIIAMSWPVRAYREPPIIFYHNDQGVLIEGQLLDFDLRIIESRAGYVVFGVGNGEIEWRGVYQIADDDLIQPFSVEEVDLIIHVRSDDTAIGEYLNACLPTFYCADLASLDGINLHPLADALDPISDESFEVVDWGRDGIAITKEIWDGQQPWSLFDWLVRRLRASADVIFCDHGSGEMADFITLQLTPEGPLVGMYHCKASKEPKAGSRVEDLYEVCGQAVKSTAWVLSDTLLKRFRHRAQLAGGKGFIKGDDAMAEQILSQQAKQQTQYEIYILQPGLRKSGRSTSVSELLAATKHYIVAMSGVQRFGIITS